MANCDLKNVENVWETLAKNDPLWAILSVPEKKENRWDVDEVFRTGIADIDHVMDIVLARGRPLARRNALDFGCGVGRLSQPLANYFEHVVGVDISTTMLELARRFNRCGSRVEYLHNNDDHLAMFPSASMDFVYSNLVLQHMPPKHALNYINEFFRITRPGGCIVFQLPSHIAEEYLPSDYTETPLPEQACRAEITLAEAAPTVLPQAGKTTIQVRVKNISAQDWGQRKVRQLNLGNHWLKTDGTIFINDDGRSRLPGKLQAGASAVLPLTVQAPVEPGEYWLEVDIVQEGVRWFKNAGSRTLSVPVSVMRPAQPPLSSTRPGTNALPQFMMEGVPKDQVLRVISDAGASVLLIEEHISEWYSYKYYIAR